MHHASGYGFCVVIRVTCRSFLSYTCVRDEHQYTHFKSNIYENIIPKSGLCPEKDKYDLKNHQKECHTT